MGSEACISMMDRVRSLRVLQILLERQGWCQLACACIWLPSRILSGLDKEPSRDPQTRGRGTFPAEFSWAP